MTSASYLGVQVLYILLGFLSLLEYLRWRDRPRLFVALTFISFAGFILTQDLIALDIDTLPVQIINRLLLLAHPALLVFLIHFIVPLGVRVRRLAQWGFFAIAAAALAVFVLPDLLNLVSLFILAYFVFFEAYAALAIVRGLRHTVGVPRRRLILVAIGTGALALSVIYLLLVGFLLKFLTPTIEWVLLIGINLSAVGHYLGFATPHWLRRTWQLSEFHRFLKTVGGQPAAQRADRALDELCRSATHLASGLAAAIVLADPATDKFRLQTLPDWPQLSGPLPALTGALGRAWAHQRSEQSANRADFGLPAECLAGLAAADTLLAVPLASPERRWGLLLVLRRGQSPFVADDFSLLTLLTEQTALALDYSTLIAQLRQRSAQLEASNKELEAFAYSVSHDLRSPLRAVDGFSQALQEDYGAQLPPAAHDYLNRIQAAVTRMASLIDDLLQLARVARAEMRVEQVDLSRLAEFAFEDLRQGQPARQVMVKLQPGLTTTGDERLLRLVLDNLLGNAWKFTGHVAAATIEFGAQEVEGVSSFFVRDNGAGFDMAHATQLFTTFHRLHSSAEFPGTGVGLAIVERIVQRHSGRVWAYAEVGQGATFSFTLNLPPVRAA